MTQISRLNVSKIIKDSDQVQNPEALAGTFDCFQVVSVTGAGAFLDWGFPQDLFVPASQQKGRMEKGESYIVYVYQEDAGRRIAATSFIDRLIYEEAPADIKEGDAVDLLICAQTDMGYKAIVNNTCWGLLYNNEVFEDLHYGQRLPGFVRQIRPDGRIDLRLQRSGYEDVGGLAGKILAHLQASGGRSPLSDRTRAEEIYRLFGVSKNKFKMALGNLYKRRLVMIEKAGVRLTHGSDGAVDDDNQ